VSTFRFSPRPHRADQIHWREWGPAAFEEAARQDRPIALFLTAFWCGVCQRLDETTLSADDVRLLLNAYFVPIRLEESQRPDVDLRYTRDGWPTIAFLSPRGEPILSVNALEPEPFISLLVKLVDAHDQHALQPAPSPDPPPASADPQRPSRATVDEIVRLLSDLADPINGGFRDAGPHKYFHAEALEFLLHLGLTDHVRLTLDTLIQRAIYDQSDGGFFRYSSRPDWNEPHPEKLLIDQADLLRLYAEAGYATTAERLIDYLEGTLGKTHPPFFAGCQDFLPEPIIDPYIYCDANAHAASAYLAAWRALGRADCRERAVRILDGLWQTLRPETGGMYHYSDGTPHVPGLLVDSVAMGLALLDGYETLGEPRFLRRANLLGREIIQAHLDPSGGFFDISQPGPGALQRPMLVLTQNAAAAKLFVRLGLREAAEWALLSYGGSAGVYGAYAAGFGHALDLFLSSGQ
jgi:uncharacterized protein YyaL (SSP411 family)